MPDGITFYQAIDSVINTDTCKLTEVEKMRVTAAL